MSDRDPYPARIVPPSAPLPTLRLLATAVRNPIETFPEAVYREPSYRRRFAGRDVVFLCDPELIRLALVEQAGAFVKGETTRRALEPALGTGLLTAEGEHWRWQRRTASPTFRQERILGFVPAMAAAAERTAVRFRANAGAEVDVAREMTLTTYDIIAETMLGGGGGDPHHVERAITDYLDPLGWVIAMSMARAPAWLPYPGRRRGDRARRFLRAEIGRIIGERRSSGESRNDLLSMLLEARDPETGQAMGDVDLADNILTFINAGHETTALALTWTLYLLDRHPDAADQMRAEIERVVGDGPVRPEHVGALDYTRQVLSEAMRLYPPAAVIVREAAQDVSIGQLQLSAGAQLYVPIYAVHRHRTLWDDPDAFDPQRFSPQAAQGRHRYAYLPFGAGPRICIGMSFALVEALVILAVLMREFRPRLRPEFTPDLRLRVTLRPGNGMPMTFDPIG